MQGGIANGLVCYPVPCIAFCCSCWIYFLPLEAAWPSRPRPLSRADFTTLSLEGRAQAW